jgi:hypothetical protein
MDLCSVDGSSNIILDGPFHSIIVGIKNLRSGKL